jgi:hypothetical protein
MALAISISIFTLLGGWLVVSALSLLCFLPFFFVMRFMEKRGAAQDH